MSFSLTTLSFFSVLLWSLATIFCSLGTGWWGKKAAPAPLVSRARTMLRFLQLALSKWSQRKKKKKKRVGRNGKKKRPDREKREWAEISLRGGVCLILSSLNDESLETADIHPKWILFRYLRFQFCCFFCPPKPNPLSPEMDLYPRGKFQEHPSAGCGLGFPLGP